GVLGFDIFQPCIFTRGLIEMPVNTDVSFHGLQNPSLAEQTTWRWRVWYSDTAIGAYGMAVPLPFLLRIRAPSKAVAPIGRQSTCVFLSFSIFSSFSNVSRPSARDRHDLQLSLSCILFSTDVSRTVIFTGWMGMGQIVAAVCECGGPIGGKQL